MFSDEQKKLLLDLFHLYAPSGKEEPVLNFIKDFLTANKIPFEQDENGNIYCLNHKDAPLLSAHTDCVGAPEDGHYVELIDIYPYCGDEVLKGIGNIGGDDKCGVFLILLELAAGRKVNAIFSICEEIGGFDGITFALGNIKDNKIFKSIPYCLVLDRKHNGDIICHNNDYGTKEFEEAVEKIGQSYGYKPVVGGCSDMNKIKEYMNGCNLSVDYYNPHSSTEYVLLGELFNTWIFVNDLIENLPRNIPMCDRTVVKTQYNTWDGRYKRDYWNY